MPAIEHQPGLGGIGVLLREWRSASGWTLGGLALRSGVAKSTLSRWEAGTKQPRIAELDAVLDALKVGAAQRREALARLEAPRAARRLREIGSTEPAGLPPLGGELLRALRLRRRATQAEVASRIGVWKSTLSRWERGEEWPATEQLHALCRALGAHPEEVAALTRGGGMLAPPAGPQELDALRVELRELEEAVWRGERELLELRCLALEARLWPRAQSEPAARQLLAHTYTCHAQWLAFWCLPGERERLARQALALIDPTSIPQAYWAWAVHTVAMALALHRKATAPLQAVEHLRQWLPIARKVPFFEAWVLRDIAMFLADAGDLDSALALGARGCTLLASEPNELRHAQMMQAQLLTRAGRPQEALPLLPSGGATLPLQQVREQLLWARTLLAAGARSEAHRWLLQAYDTIEAHGLSAHQSEADLLARQL